MCHMCVCVHVCVRARVFFFLDAVVDPLFMGCHSDSGFGHQVRSFYSNLLFGESFEPVPGEPHPWAQTIIPSTAKGANVTLVSSGMHGQTALRVRYTSGSGVVGLGNRGFRNGE